MVLKANFLTWLSKLSWSISKEIQVDNWLILIFLNIAAWMLLLRFSDPYKIVKFWFLLLNFLFLFSKIQKFYSILIILHCGFRDNCNWSCFKWILHISTHQSICIRIMSLFFRSKMNWCVEVMTVSVHKCCTSAAISLTWLVLFSHCSIEQNESDDSNDEIKNSAYKIMVLNRM